MTDLHTFPLLTVFLVGLGLILIAALIGRRSACASATRTTARASAFSGYCRSVLGKRSMLPIYLVALLISGGILLILDLDRPSAGFIEISQQPMIDTGASINSYLK